MDFPWSSADVADLPTVGVEVDTLAGLSTLSAPPGARLAATRRAAEAFRREFPTTGTPGSITTCDLNLKDPRSWPKLARALPDLAA